MFQSYHLIDELTVYENLETPLLYRNTKGPERKSRGLRRSTVSRSWASRPLPQPVVRRPAAARGCSPRRITDPKLILADEPTGNLSSNQGNEIMDMFKELNDDGDHNPSTHSEKRRLWQADHPPA